MKGDAHGVGGPLYGPGLDRELVDEALSVDGAVLWSLRFEADQVTWTPGLDRLLRMPGAGNGKIRARLLELLKPLTIAARSGPVWQDLELEQPIETPAGVGRFLAFRARRFGDTRTGGLVGVVTDATRSHGTRQELADLADRYRLLVELSPEAICVHQDGVVKYVNPSTVTMVGAECDAQIVGRPITDFVSPPDIPPMQKRIASLTTPGATTPATEVEIRRLDGGTVLVESVSVRTTWEGQLAFQVIMRDVTEQKAVEDALRYQATHDELTDLLNRKGIKSLLADLQQGSPRQLAVLLCDIDNFKRVNDSLGHEAGDELLAALARRLRSGLPDGCIAGRLSGDEFLVICARVDSIGGLEAFAGWVAGFLRTVVPVRNELVSVSASVGAAQIDSGMTGDDLLRYADMAMFQAKSLGAGHVALADPAKATSVEGQLRLEEQLRDALRDDELTLHYQPMVDTDGRVVMAEALVRWPHPERGLLSPGPLLTVAEQGDLLGRLDRWVLRTALREAARWPEPDGEHIGISVNLAGLLPDDPDFVDVITSIVDESGIDARRLILEVTETAVVDLSVRSRNAMIELIDRGVRFAVDDFGTGYSSLARLKDVPAQIIKLDRRFVSEVETDPADFAIARAVTDMARSMGRSCIAEGVETDGQRKVLDCLGIDLYQGFLFSRPVPARDFRALLQSP